MTSNTTSETEGGGTSRTVAVASDRLPAHKSDVVLSTANRELFWRAKYLNDSPSLPHLPFLFWLISDLQPVLTVTLNLGAGVGHFAICQTLDKIGMDARCQGYGQWDGNGVPGRLEDYNSAQYEEFSQLAEAGPEEAIDLWHGGPVDLLLIEAPGPGVGLDALLDGWAARMSRRGVIILTGAGTLSPEQVSQLDAFAADRLAVRLDHDGGLIAVAVGAAVAGRLDWLGQLDSTGAAFLGISRIFSRLGKIHEYECRARAARGPAGRRGAGGGDAGDGDGPSRTPEATGDASRDLDALRSEFDRFRAITADEKKALQAALDKARHELSALQSERGAAGDPVTLRAEIDGLRAELASTRETAMASAVQAQDDMRALSDELKARSEDLEQAARDAEALRTQLAEAERRADSEAVRHDAETSELKEMLARNQADAEGTRHAAEDIRDRAEQDIATLTRTLAEAEERVIAAEEEKKQLRHEFDRLTAERADQARALETLRSEHTALTRERADQDRSIEELKGRVQAEREAAEQLSQRVSDTRSEIVSVRMERDAEEAQKTAVKKELDTVRGQLAQQRDRTTQLEGELQDERQRTAALRRESRNQKAAIAELREECARLVEARDHMLRSTSWKVTEPLRYVKTAVRGRGKPSDP